MASRRILRPVPSGRRDLLRSHGITEDTPACPVRQTGPTAVPWHHGGYSGLSRPADGTYCGPMASWRIPLASRRSILIVDSSDETGVVLQTALGRRGVRTFLARRARQGLELAQTHHPDLIVLDLEVDRTGSDPADLSASFAELSRADHAPLVVLGTARRSAPLPCGEFVAKPYHYGPLLRRIEELLDSRLRESRPCRRCS
jgi:CheY-like chemotaxis protein